ncbi:hypothetical protein ABIB90_006261 [Bradyrhizobium sp. JR4.1]
MRTPGTLIADFVVPVGSFQREKCSKPCKERIIGLLGCEEKIVTKSLKNPSRDPNIRNHSVGIVVACGKLRPK